MIDSTITVPAGTAHLSEILTYLPKNCLFNKGATGAGGTTIALINDLPSVICVPFLPMIENKIKQSAENNQLYPYEVFAFHGKVSDADLSFYLSFADLPKIMVTYDSLPRLIAHLYFDASQYHLLVDEYHCLFMEYSFRNPAIKGVLNSFRAFQSFTFMSATPIDAHCLLEELEGIPMVTAVWEDLIRLQIDSINCQVSLRKAIASRIRFILEGNIEANHYFFVNSVRFIHSMITSCKLTDENCRVIYSDSNPKTLKVKRGKAGDEAKKINFITKCCFEGVDFYDPVGLIYVVSETHGGSALIDISTQLQQIAGRIRDSKYKHVVCHIYSTTPVSSAKTLEEFTTESDKLYQSELKAAAMTVAYEPDERVRLAEKFPWRYHYFDEASKEFVLDPNLRKFELYAFNLRHQVYKSHVNVSNEYRKQSLSLISKRFQRMPQPEILAETNTSFKRMVLELERLTSLHTNTDESSEYHAFLSESITRFPFLPNALQHLGFEGMREKDYHKGNIEKFIESRIVKSENKAELHQVQALLQNHPEFKVGSELLGSTVKKTLNKCNRVLGIQEKAKAGHIQRYFKVTNTVKVSKVTNSKQRVYTIIEVKQLE